MKMLSIIIRPDKLEKLKKILNRASVNGLTVLSAMGCGSQRGLTDAPAMGQGINGMNLIPKILAITVVSDASVNDILAEINSEISSGKVGDGKVFVTEVLDAMRIRTGERGKDSI